MTLGVGLAMLGAAIAIILSAVGATIGVSKVSAAANAVLTKEPKHFSKLLILMMLPSSQAIYGLVVAFMIFIQIGILPGSTFVPATTELGAIILLLCLPVAILGIVTTIIQGNVGVTAVNLYTKQNKTFGNCILIMSVTEVFALFGFLISILGVLFIVPTHLENLPEVYQATSCILSAIA
ncbi:MAG: permease [Firmicutes bacterium]|nr:permease [Bacillota bacterium]